MSANNSNPFTITNQAVVAPSPSARAVKHLKVTLNDDTRRFSVFDDADKYAQLVKNVRDVYALPDNAVLLFKYHDEDGDFITVASNSELTEGFRVAGDAALRLTVTVTKAHSQDVAPMLRLSPAIPAPVAEVNAAPPMMRLAPAIPAPAPKPAEADGEGHRCGGRWRRAPDAKYGPGHGHPHGPHGHGFGHGHGHAHGHQMWFHKHMEEELAKDAPKDAPKTDKNATENKKVDSDVVAVLKERNQALRTRLEHCKQRIHELKDQRDAGKLPLQSLLRERAIDKSGPKCKAMLARGRFVTDVTIEDGTVLAPGAQIIKTWRFRNDSAEAWPAGTRLLFVGKNSDRMAAPDFVLVDREVAPGAEVDISVPLTAPDAAGRYTTYFRLCDANERKFGQRVWCSVIVKEPNASSSSDDEKAPAVLDADMVKYAHQLQVLAEMNLTNIRVNIRLLNKFDGNLEQVVERIFAHRTKMAARRADPALAGKCEERRGKWCERKAERMAAKAERHSAKVEKKQDIESREH